MPFLCYNKIGVHVLVKYIKLSNITGYENAIGYLLSSEGKVYSYRNLDDENHSELTEVKGSKDSKGYLCLDIRHTNSIRKYPKIHRLIAQAFIPNENKLPQVNHINGDKTDNSVSNLEWVSNRQNRIHAIENGLQDYIDYGIAQYDLNGNLIATYDTAEEALIKLGKPPYSGNIGRVIRGKRKTAYGYIWKQIDSSTTIEKQEKK